LADKEKLSLYLILEKILKLYLIMMDTIFY